MFLVSFKITFHPESVLFVWKKTLNNCTDFKTLQNNLSANATELRGKVFCLEKNKDFVFWIIFSGQRTEFIVIVGNSCRKEGRTGRDVAEFVIRNKFYQDIEWFELFILSKIVVVAVVNVGKIFGVELNWEQEARLSDAYSIFLVTNKN